jgi:hypothetical protein
MRLEDKENSSKIRWLQNIAVREKMAEYAGKFPWQFWMTGTFKPDQSYRDTIKTKRAFYRFEDDLRDKFGKGGIEHFMAVERFKHGEFTHVHSLMNGLEGLTDTQVWETWFNRFGRATVEPYDSSKGAAHYLTKYLVKEVCDWDLKIDLRKSEPLNFASEYENSRGVIVRKALREGRG